MTENKLKMVFKVKDEAGKETEYAVLRPSPKVLSDGQKVYNRKFRELVESGTIIRDGLDRILKDQKVWDEDKEAEAEKLRAKVADMEKALGRGKMKLSEGRKLALDLSKARGELTAFVSRRNSAQANTAEAQADNERFSFFVSVCLVYNDTGERVFPTYEDYLEKGTSAHALQGANHLSIMLGGGDADFWKKLPENKFLLQYKFMDDQGRLINKDGKLIDQEGRLIDEDGYYVNSQGKRVDRDGLLLDKDGNYLLEDSGPFIDDETGKPIGGGFPHTPGGGGYPHTPGGGECPTPPSKAEEKSPSGSSPNTPVPPIARADQGEKTSAPPPVLSLHVPSQPSQVSVPATVA